MVLGDITVSYNVWGAEDNVDAEGAPDPDKVVEGATNDRTRYQDFGNHTMRKQ